MSRSIVTLFAFCAVQSLFAPLSRAAPILDPDPMISQILKTTWEVLQDCPPPKCVPILIGQSPSYIAATLDYLNTPYRFFPLSMNKLSFNAGAGAEKVLSDVSDQYRELLNARFKNWIGELPSSVESVEVIDRIIYGDGLHAAKKIIRNGLDSMGKQSILVSTGAMREGLRSPVFPDLKRPTHAEALSAVDIDALERTYHFDHIHVLNMDSPLMSDVSKAKIFGIREAPFGKAPPDLAQVEVSVEPWNQYKGKIRSRIENYRKQYTQADQAMKELEQSLHALNRQNPLQKALIPTGELNIKAAESKTTVATRVEPVVTRPPGREVKKSCVFSFRSLVQLISKL
jgi:hypothetical protein